MKYRIITASGVTEATDAVPFRYSHPKWLSKIRFFTNRYIDGRPTKRFTVTEVSTGMELCKRGFITRKQAKDFTKKRLLESASNSSVTAIKRVIREYRLPK